MLRKLTIMLAVMAAIGVAAIPTGASAAWHGGGWHGGGWQWWRLARWLAWSGLGLGCWRGIARRSANRWSACSSLLLWLRALLLRRPLFLRWRPLLRWMLSNGPR